MTLLAEARRAGLDAEYARDGVDAKHPNGKTYILRTPEDIEHMAIELGLAHSQHIRVGQVWASTKPANVRTGRKQRRIVLAIAGDHAELTSDVPGLTTTVRITKKANDEMVINFHRLVSERAAA